MKADYEARLEAVVEELKSHAESARQTIEQKQHFRLEVKKKEKLAAERLAETELRHAVGEYDDAAWTQVHKDAMAELVTLREELQAVEADIEKLQELDTLVRAGPQSRPTEAKPLDELAFIKSVTADDKSAVPAPKRASGAQHQPNSQLITPLPAPTPIATPAPPAAVPTPPPVDDDADDPRPLKCRDCGTMNLPTEWYCEQCGAELAAV